MGGRLDRERKRKYARELELKYGLKRITHCPNCKERFTKGASGHFAPPGMGDPGFFICEKVDAPKEEKAPIPSNSI